MSCPQRQKVCNSKPLFNFSAKANSVRSSSSAGKKYKCNPKKARQNNSRNSYKANPMSSSAMIRQQLSQMESSFEGFEKAVKLNSSKKRMNNNRKLTNIRIDIAVIKEDLQKEAKARDQDLQQLSMHYQSKIVKTRKEIEIPINQKIAAIAESIQHLNNKLIEMKKIEDQHSQQMLSIINRNCDIFSKQIQNMKSKFEESVEEKKISYQSIVSAIKGQKSGMNACVNNEQQARQRQIEKLNEDIAQNSDESKISFLSMQEYLEENIKQLHAKLQESEKERKSTTNEVVKALCHCTNVLQEGMKTATEAAD